MKEKSKFKAESKRDGGECEPSGCKPNSALEMTGAATCPVLPEIAENEAAAAAN